MTDLHRLWLDRRTSKTGVGPADTYASEVFGVARGLNPPRKMHHRVGTIDDLSQITATPGSARSNPCHRTTYTHRNVADAFATAIERRATGPFNLAAEPALRRDDIAKCSKPNRFTCPPGCWAPSPI